MEQSRFPGQRPKAMLIDMDDTILADEPVSEPAWRAVCREYAALAGAVSGDTLYAAIKSVADAFWSDPEKHRTGRLNLKATRREVVRAALQQLGKPDDYLADRIADRFTEGKSAAIAPGNGARAALHRFKAAGIRLALVTNGSAEVQREKIARFGLEPLFDCILIEGEFGNGKPHADIFTTAMQKLGVRPSETWMVGDDLKRDIGGAQALGIYGIWVDWRKAGLPANSAIRPDRIVASLGEVGSKWSYYESS